MFNEFRTKYLTNFWDVGKAMIALAILSSIYFGIFGGVWAVTGEMTRWGGEFLELFGADLSGYSYYQMQNLNGTPISRTDGVMLIGMFIGALVAALVANKVKFRFPASPIRIFQAIVGGMLSGFGARLAFGCNLADFFTGLPYFSVHTWVFMVFMIIGIYTATKVGNLKIFRPKAVLQKFGINGKGIEHDNSRKDRHFKYGIIVFALMLVWFFYLVFNNPSLNIKDKSSLLSLALLFGFAFGFIISKGQVCFTSCFRDLFLFGRDTAAKGVFYGMIISTLIVFAFMLNDYHAKVVSISLGVVVGAFLFGFGIVFAGGCECGWTYRATEGQLHFMIVGIANVVGTMILALSYDKFPSAFKDGAKINLLDTFGNLGGLAINLIMLIATILVIFYYKKQFFARGGY
jgi:inner membrane protein yedE